MKTVIAGSRSITDYNLISTYLERLPYTVTEVISGTAAGVDRLGERWAREHGIPVKRMPAQWGKFGKGAGYIRNKEMVKYAAEHHGRVVVFWDGVSKGAMHTARLAGEQGILPEVFEVQK